MFKYIQLYLRRGISPLLYLTILLFIIGCGDDSPSTPTSPSGFVASITTPSRIVKVNEAVPLLLTFTKADGGPVTGTRGNAVLYASSGTLQVLESSGKFKEGGILDMVLSKDLTVMTGHAQFSNKTAGRSTITFVMENVSTQLDINIYNEDS